MNGGSTPYSYLYCTGSAPHQLTGLYPTGTTCANLSGAVYQSGYDAWGNVISRTENGTTATLSYDLLDHFVKWNAGTNSREWYAYDGSSNRVLRRTINGSSTVVTIFAFGAEYSYNGSGTLKSSTHYYALGGHLIGELLASPAQSTNIFLTDAQGTVLATFSNTQGSAAVLANQLYGPYGTSRYSGGSMAPYTDKGYTGQYNDALTGLDDYNARYYDPTVGVFLSADTVQGNVSGMNPYAYVGGNPETMTDPTGKYYAGHNGESGYVVQDSNGDGGETLYTYVQGWQTTYHYNSQHQVDSVNGSPENRSKVARTCGIFCGAVKDQGVEIQGVTDIALGAGEATVGIAALAQLGTLAASWIAGGLSDMLYGLRMVATNHTEVNPHFLFGLDAAKFFVDTVQVILLLFNIGHLVTNSGPGKALLNKVGYIGGVIKGWFTGQQETMKTLIATGTAIMSNVFQLTSAQSGAAMPLVTDYNNIVSDSQAIQSYDNTSDY